MEQTILTKRQQQLLDLFAQEPHIQQSFFLSGDTTLAEYYLKHRLSEDLDFFSLEEIDATAIQILLQQMKTKMNIQKITFKQSFNRNLFFLHFPDEIIKTEFT